jgi:transposase
MIPAGVRIFVCTEPIDMRYGMDRLVAAARLRVGEDSQQGDALYVFSNRGANRLKILWFDRSGYCSTSDCTERTSSCLQADRGRYASMRRRWRSCSRASSVSDVVAPEA